MIDRSIELFGIDSSMSPSRALVASFCLLFLVTHLWSLPSTLEDIDSVNFGLGVESFDVAAHRPHPPGYPVYIAMAKMSTAALGVLAPSWDRDERAAAGLALWGVLAGTLALWIFARFWLAIGFTPIVAWLAALVAVVCPLFWFTAARPLSDTVGLVIPIGCMALLVAARNAPNAARLGVIGAFLTGLGVGVRSQTMWLAGAFLVWLVAALAKRHRVREALWVVAAAGVGVLLWAVPLVWLSGGLDSYLASLRFQGEHDFQGGHMLYTNPSWRLFRTSMHWTFVEPWQARWLAAGVLLLAVVGASHLMRRNRAQLGSILLAFVPYLVFHLLFQETLTMRYGLPMVVPVAGLAAAGLSAFGTRVLTIGAAAAAVVSLVIVQPRLARYAERGAPVFRAFQDMQRALPAEREPPVLRMHHQVWWGVRRAIEWYRPVWDVGAQPHPGDREWLAAVLHWTTGQTRPIFFLSELTRNDLAQFDPRTRTIAGRYETPGDIRALVGGARLEGLTWHVIRSPRWMLGTGWSLTPEIAGMTTRDRSAPHQRPAEAFLRRDPTALRIMIGGRYLSNPTDAPALVSVELGQVRIAEWTVGAEPRWFVQWVDLPGGVPAGSGPYAALTVRVASAVPGRPAPSVGLEQFDAAPVDDLIVSFTDGWHELEEDAATGRLWRWTSDRSAILVRDATVDLRLTIAGESPLRYFDRAPEVAVKAGDLEIARFTPSADFVREIDLPASALRASAGRVTIETDLTYVPAERGGSPDRRRLGLRLYQVDVTRR
jgi:hypothetical protein